MNQQLETIQQGFESELFSRVSSLEERMRTREATNRQEYHRKLQQELESSSRACREEFEALFKRSQAEKERELAAMEARWTDKLKLDVSP